MPRRKIVQKNVSRQKIDAFALFLKSMFEEKLLGQKLDTVQVLSSWKASFNFQISSLTNKFKLHVKYNMKY